ncbi:long-chain acyl-CoA synthetase [Syntrophus gentianae]|uniref:Long-chain acyl-CoA synthetase n=1 Tax=Syntrophus gentianae TaxID=43775 RepID=A0A1H7UD94_9BACT|nr:long-chain fatty acid--CoA ligase [Syntrophus gentianae]SEL95030.1 long-chain acyl-CoA synthetase [Syntrophus gentianae]
MGEHIRYSDKPWLQSYERGVQEHLTYEEISLPDILQVRAAENSDAAALIYQGYRMNYRQLQEEIEHLSGFLVRSGIGRGEAVALLLPNCIPLVVAYYAVLRMGGIVVMHNPLYTDRELEYQLADSEASAVIALDLFGNRVIDLKKKTKIRMIVIASLGDYLPFPENLFFRLFARWKKLSAPVKPASGVVSWKKSLRHATAPLAGRTSNLKDVAVYAYTGGTTGLPKGVELTHANLSRQVQQCAAWFPQFKSGGETMLGALPYFHAFGMTTAMNLSIYKGWSQILLPRPKSGSILEAIRKYRPTFAPLVPAMFAGMLRDPDFGKTDMSCLKGAFSGGAPLSQDLLRDFENRAGVTIVEGYGMTETSPVTLINPFEGRKKRKPGSVGVPISDTLCRIVDSDNGMADVPLGKRGELIISGPQVMKGYKGRPEETAQVLRDGWCFTGDIAVMDDDGYVFLVDRKKDLILSGGYNIYPTEIEEVLTSHPKVAEVCAVGVPDEIKGEKVKVFVVLKEGQSVTEGDLLDYCRAKLAAYKCPSLVEFRGELPKSIVGKTLRRALRDAEAKKV